MFKQNTFKINSPIFLESFKKDIIKILILSIILLIVKLDFSGLFNNLELTTMGFVESMVQTKDYSLLQLRGVFYLDEGPLVIWGHALVLKLFGNTVIVNRIFTGMCVTVSAIIMYYLISIRFSSRIGWISIVLLLTCPIIFILSGMIDVNIILGMVISQFLLSFWIIGSKHQKIPSLVYWIMSLSFISGFLISGTFVIIYLFLILSINSIFNKYDFSGLRNIPKFSILIVFLVCGYWLIVASLNNPINTTTTTTTTKHIF